ncbi:cell number regulator 2 [Artemisia annua]|uniref:Cell number regulator 2 n=1 Tax=Artemisia annua TaxID=35608 RepID=A0A2U1KT47_ARTAN|nr:cell number regulator 2 [Artemisia annua]
MSSTKQNDYQKLLSAPLSHEDELLAAVHLDSNTPAEWSSGLSNCCSDASLCCITCWCPCVTVGRIAEAVDDGKTSYGVGRSTPAIMSISDLYRPAPREKGMRLHDLYRPAPREKGM